MSAASGSASRTRQSVVVGATMGVLISAVLLLVSLTPVGNLFQRWEFALYDFRLHQFAQPELASDELVVVTVDDATIRALELEGIPWPPPRWFYGDFVATLATLEPRAIVFDWVFADQRDGVRYGLTGDPFAEVSSDNAQLAGLEFTRAAAKQMHAAGMVVQGVYAMNLQGTDEQIRLTSGWNERLVPYFDRRIPPFTGGGDVPEYEATPGFHPVLRFPEGSMLVGARALGLVNQQHVNDLDGVSRRFEPVTRLDGRIVADLATTALVVGTAGRADNPDWSFTAPPPADAWPPLPPIRRTASGIRAGAWDIPLDDEGRGYIRWRGHWESTPALRARTRSALDVWANRDAIQLGLPHELDPADYKDKIVLLGFTGQGEGSDYVSTPFGPQPGVFRHAAILDTILTQDFPAGLPGAMHWVIAFLLAGVTGGFVLARAGARTRMSGNTVLQVTRLSAIGLLPLAVFTGFALLAFAGPALGSMPTVILDMVPPLLATSGTIPLVVFLGIAWAQAGERRARKMAVRALGPALVKQVEAGGGELRMGGERVPLTLYFSDIAGFTTISEKLSPEELIQILNEYLTRVSEILHDGHGATIDKYIGDAVMAFWGAPLPQPDGPVRACLAALDVMSAIDVYSNELVAQGLSPLRTRIGINTGPAVAGGVGHVRDAEDGKFSYTAMGDTVNLASRLEGANKAYGTTCMLGPETYEQAKHAIIARELDLVRVKGKTIPVRVYELMGRAGQELPRQRLVKERYEAALARYRAREFDRAREAFLALIAEFDDEPSKTLAANCEERLRNPPPPEWDGSNELHEK